MSSRVIRPEDLSPDTKAAGAIDVKPIAWRVVGAGAPSASNAPVEPANAPAQPDPKIEERLREARAAGVREGETAGRNRAAAELNPVLEKLTRAIDETAGIRARLRREAEGDLVCLALAIARRILRRELAVDPEALHGLVLGALEKLQSNEILRVRLHPAHAGFVKERLQQFNTASAAEIIPDPSRELGAVIFETARGTLDASVESQLREIERGLADRLNHSK